MNRLRQAGVTCLCFLLITFVGAGATSRAEAAETLATYTFGTGWATFGLVLPPGKAFTGVSVGDLPTQTDVKVRYPDQSIRFAIVTARITAAGSYAIAAASQSTGSFAPALPAASVEISVSGQTYVAQLPVSLPASWLDGPLVREGRAVQTFAGATGAAAALRAIFDVRSYAGGGHRVDVTISNNLNVSTAREVAYGLVIRVNGTALFTRAGSTVAGPSPFSAMDPTEIYTARNHGLVVGDTVRLTSGTGVGKLYAVTTVVNADSVKLNYLLEVPLPVTWERMKFVQPYLTRMRKTFVVGGLAEADVTPDFTPFQLANAFPPYLSLVANPSPSISGPQFEPFRIGSLVHPLAAPGGRPEIGPYPAWVSHYVVHKRPAQRAYMLAMGSNAAGAISVHMDDADGSMLLLDRRPNFNLTVQDLTGESGPAGGGSQLRGILYAAEVGAAHTASLAYVPYLVTGDRFFLDEMKYWANGAMLTVSWGRNGAAGLITAQQVRAMGWAMRDLSDAAAYTPDGDPHKEYFRQKTLNNIADLDRMAAAETDSLGGSRFGEPIDYQQKIFMQSYAAWGFDHAGKQGFPTPRYVDRLVRYWNNLYSAHPAFDRRYVVSYTIETVHAATGASFRSYGELFDYNLNKRTLDPWKNYQPPAQASGISYNMNAYMLLVMAKQMGLPNADANISYVVNATEGGYTTKADFTLTSQYAIAASVSDVGFLGGGPVAAPTGLRIVSSGGGLE
jgi:hypothetical protein